MCVIVVTLDRPTILSRVPRYLNFPIKPFDKGVRVDNTSGEDMQHFLKKLPNYNLCKILPSEENLGGAVGLVRAIHKVMECTLNWPRIMYDNAFALAEFLHKLLKAEHLFDLRIPVLIDKLGKCCDLNSRVGRRIIGSTTPYWRT